MGSPPKLDPGRDTRTGPRAEGDKAATQIRALVASLPKEPPEHRAARRRTTVEDEALTRRPHCPRCGANVLVAAFGVCGRCAVEEGWAPGEATGTP